MGYGNKVTETREYIHEEIVLGNYSRGTALPPEREMAERAGVSYMTLRKAVDLLVAEGCLERVAGVGTFVCSTISENKLPRQLGAVIPAWGAPENMDFIMHLSAAARQENWIPKFVFARSWRDRTIADLYQTSDALVTKAIEDLNDLPNDLAEKFRSREKPVVISGGDAVPFGFDSVSPCFTEEAAELCERLHQLGHRRFLQVEQFERRNGGKRFLSLSDNGIGECFRRRYPDVDYDDTTLLVEVPSFGQPFEAIHEKILRLRAKTDCTAIVCPLPFYWGVYSALTDLGLRVPEDVSVVCVGDRLEANYYRPRPATLTPPLHDLARNVFEQIRWRQKNPRQPARNLLFNSCFQPGQTLAAARNQ